VICGGGGICICGICGGGGGTHISMICERTSGISKHSEQGHRNGIYMEHCRTGVGDDAIELASGACGGDRQKRTGSQLTPELAFIPTGDRETSIEGMMVTFGLGDWANGEATPLGNGGIMLGAERT
jgi:hypothetical protein